MTRITDIRVHRDGDRSTIEATVTGDGWTTTGIIALERLAGDLVGTSDGDIRIATTADVIVLPGALMPEICDELRRIVRASGVWVVAYRDGYVWRAAADCESEAVAKITLAALSAADERGCEWRIVAPGQENRS